MEASEDDSAVACPRIPRSRQRSYGFCGLPECAGGNMAVTGGDRGGPRRYGCSRRHNGLCKNSLTIKTAVLDDVIAAEIRERLAVPEKLEEAAAAA